MSYTAHLDTFARDNLPARELWPEFSFDLPELRYPERLNCATGLLDRAIERLLMFDRRVEAAEGDAQAREDAALLLEELILRGGEDLRQHAAFRCAGSGPRPGDPTC